MKSESRARLGLLQGTLDLLIVRTLMPGPAHGHAIARYIQRTSEDALKVETGSLYPALHWLDARGSSWEMSEEGRRAKYYRLTAAGRKQLASEHSKRERLSRAIGLVLRPPGQEPA